MTKLTNKEIRTLGIGEGFKVIDPADGYRKDNTIWFGTCSVCGERVSHSVITDYKWRHSSGVTH